MFASAQHAINAYQRVNVETGVQSADSHRLIQMLYEGVALALSDARRHMERGETAAKGAALSKAITIIQNGLRASLDIPAGGELGERLAALYDYMVARLLSANLHNRAELVDEVSRLLGELRGAWDQIRPAATPRPANAAGAALRSV